VPPTDKGAMETVAALEDNIEHAGLGELRVIIIW
jgi:hypothetical protein